MNKGTTRSSVGELLVAMLVGLAIQEVTAPIRESVRATGFTFGTTVLFIVFFLTALRFFIGNHLHLKNEQTLSLSSAAWTIDFLVIVFECVLFIFLGGICSVESQTAIDPAKRAHVDFISLLMLILVIDVLWILSQPMLGKIHSSLQRASVPWPWLWLNLTLLAVMAILRFGVFQQDPYGSASLAWVGAVNVVAFLADVFLIDRHDLI